MTRSAHLGKVRAFPELGHATSRGRRWAAHCSCGWAVTAAHWAEVLEALSQHQAEAAA